MENKTKILALWGKSNNGKSETILKLVDLLINDGAKIENVKNTRRNAKDKWFVLRYKNKLIGITSRGDTCALLEEDFNNFKKCDICICATHTSGATIKFIEENYHYDNIYWLRKASFSVGTNYKEKNDHLKSEYEYLNHRQAEDMMYLLDKCLFIEEG